MSPPSTLTRISKSNDNHFRWGGDFCIAGTLIIFDALLTLASIFKRGIFVDQKSLLMQKTNKELKAMLVGVKRISNLNKKQLVELGLVN